MEEENKDDKRTRKRTEITRSRIKRRVLK